MTDIKYTALSALLGAVLLLAGCSPDDDDIVIDGTSAIFHNCDGSGDTWFAGKFGQYYLQGYGCGGAGIQDEHRYSGDPTGAIVLRWKAIYLDPSKSDRPYAEQVIQRRYFYAESHEPIEMPPRRDNHWLYEVHVSFGPRLLWSKRAIPKQPVALERFDRGGGRMMYAAGEVDTLYYFIRSRPTWVPREGGMLPSVKEAAYEYQAIKGIELTEAQYMTIDCEKVGRDKCDERLEEDAPGLTGEQLAYLRAARAKAKAKATD